MKVSNQPGYPLPDGELGEDEIVCQLVYLPDRPEYWQAFLGALHYMTTWRAWERDDDKRGKDAASNWREAFELTIGCWRMTCLDELQNNVAAILSLLQNQDPCCNDNITYFDSDTYITIIIPDYGDPPEFYGETEVEDWDEWKEYLCHNANLWVDELIRAASTIEVALDTGGIAIGLLAAVLTAVAFLTVGGVIALPLLLVIVYGLTANLSSTIFAQAASDIEDARDQINCAILGGRDVALVIEDTVSELAWDLLYSHFPYDTAIAILYEGGNGDDVFLEAELDDTCTCLCLHAVKAEAENTIGGISSVGCWFILPRRAGYGYSNVAYGSIVFNNVDPVMAYCGPMKTIDSIAAQDGLKFNRIQTMDQDDNIIDDWYQPLHGCDFSLDLLVGKTCARVYFERFQVSDGGCGSAYITIDVTYHDA